VAKNVATQPDFTEVDEALLGDVLNNHRLRFWFGVTSGFLRGILRVVPGKLSGGVIQITNPA
jgi:hypothetical protein